MGTVADRRFPLTASRKGRKKESSSLLDEHNPAPRILPAGLGLRSEVVPWATRMPRLVGVVAGGRRPTGCSGVLALPTSLLSTHRDLVEQDEPVSRKRVIRLMP